MIPMLTDPLSGLSDVQGLRLLLDPLLKGLILIVAAGLGVSLFRSKPACLRSTVWTLLICGLILVPISSFLTPRLMAPVVTVHRHVPSVVVTPDTGSFRAAVPGEKSNQPATAARSDPSPRLGVWSPSIVALLVWTIIAAALLTRTVLRLSRTRRVIRSATPVISGRLFDSLAHIRTESGVRPVGLFLSGRFDSPFIAGWLRPRLVLPIAAALWDDDELYAVLRHELAHVRRHDMLRLVLADVACALNWHNPLVWRAARATALSCEMACDDHAARVGGDPRGYARTLLSLAARVSSGRTAPTPGLAHASGIELRLRHVLVSGTEQPRARLTGAVLVPALVLMGFVLSGSAVRTVTDTVPVSIQVPASPAETEERAAGVVTEPDIAIHDLIRDGLTDPALSRLDARPELLESRDDEGMTPLARAAWNEHLPLLDTLLDRGADPDALNHNGLTPLFSALDRGNRAVANCLIDAGADLAVTGYRNWTLLHAAVRMRDRGIVHRLLKAGLDPNAVSTMGRTPVHMAARFDDRDIMDDLAAAGAVASPNPRPWKTFDKHIVTVR